MESGAVASESAIASGRMITGIGLRNRAHARDRQRLD